MGHSINEARAELAEARKAGRSPAGWATTMAEEALVMQSDFLEPDLDALCEAAFGFRPSGPGGVRATVSEGPFSEVDAVSEAVFGSVVDEPEVGSTEQGDAWWA